MKYKPVYKCRICGNFVQDDDSVYTQKDVENLDYLHLKPLLENLHDCEEDAPIEGEFRGILDFVGFVKASEEMEEIVGD